MPEIVAIAVPRYDAMNTQPSIIDMTIAASVRSSSTTAMSK
jgi:hypothetical protein